jgi:hypothetical protein
MKQEKQNKNTTNANTNLTRFDCKEKTKQGYDKKCI